MTLENSVRKYQTHPQKVEGMGAKMMRTIFGGRRGGGTALYRDTREGNQMQNREAQAHTRRQHTSDKWQHDKWQDYKWQETRLLLNHGVHQEPRRWVVHSRGLPSAPPHADTPNALPSRRGHREGKPGSAPSLRSC